MWPELIHTAVFMLLRTAPLITIKQLLSLDIIKPGQNVDGEVNPPVAQRPKSGQGGGCGYRVQTRFYLVTVSSGCHRTNTVFHTDSLKCISACMYVFVCACLAKRCLASTIHGGRRTAVRRLQSVLCVDAEPMTRKGSGLSTSQHVTQHRPADILITMQAEVPAIG